MDSISFSAAVGLCRIKMSSNIRSLDDIGERKGVESEENRSKDGPWETPY